MCQAHFDGARCTHLTFMTIAKSTTSTTTTKDRRRLPRALRRRTPKLRRRMLNSSTSTTHAKHLTLLASAKHFDGLRQPHRRIDGMCQQHLRRRTPSTSTAYTELKHLNGGLRKPQRRINNDARQAIRRSCKRQTNGSGSASAKTKHLGVYAEISEEEEGEAARWQVANRTGARVLVTAECRAVTYDAPSKRQ